MQKRQKLKIKKLHPEAVIPSYAKASDAGLDLTAISYEFKNNRHVYGTGLAFEIPEGHVGLIFPRSSIMKKDLRLTNAVGVIDAGFRGEVKAFFENVGMSDLPFNNVYNVGERFGQLVVLEYPYMDIEVVNELSDSDRGSGGFGSTGV